MTFYVSLGIQRRQRSDGKLIEIVFALLLHLFFNLHIFSPLQALHKCTTFYISSEDDQPLLHLRDGDKGEDERVRISVVALGEST